MRAPSLSLLSTLTLSALLAGCDIEETTPQSQIDRLRVLSIRIDGPPAKGGLAELSPGDTAVLTPLVLAPGIAPLEDMAASQQVCLEDYHQPRWDRGGPACPSKTASVHRFWFWCPPRAATLYDDPCTDLKVLDSPARVFQTAGIEPLGSSCAAPIGGPVAPTPTACIQPPADLFARLPQDSLTRRRGVLMSVLLVTVIDVDGDAEAGRLAQLVGKIQANEVPAVVALKRVPVVDRPTNHNPEPVAISSSSGEITTGKTIGREERLRVSFMTPDPEESFVRIDNDGTEAQKVEQLTVAWLSGFGRYDAAHTLLKEENLYTPAKGSGLDRPPLELSGPSYPIPFVVVIRDGRGGEGWLVRRVLVPKSLP